MRDTVDGINEKAWERAMRRLPTAAELAAEIRAKERADLERSLARGEPEDASCHWCGRVFRPKGWDKWDKTYFMRDIRQWGNGICRERAEEQQ